MSVAHETGFGPKTHRSYDESAGPKKTYHPKSILAKSSQSELAIVPFRIERSRLKQVQGVCPERPRPGPGPVFGMLREGHGFVTAPARCSAPFRAESHSSTAAAQRRPSSIAQTMRLWPRRASPAAKTPGALVA